MSLNSVVTNVGAQIALQSLTGTASQLQAAEKQVSTGYRVADATDDGAAFAVAQRVRTDVAALTTVNQQLGNAQGLVGTALTALTSISNTVSSAKSLLVDIGDSSISQNQRDQYVSAYKSLVTEVANTVDSSTYNGATLLGAATSAVAGTATSVISNEAGQTATISAEDVSALANTLATLIGSTFTRDPTNGDSFGTISAGADQSSAASALTATSGATSFSALLTSLDNQLNQAGADSNYLTSTISFNSNKIDSLNAGLGSLIDADLAKESATLQALQIRQQLGTQALSLANQAPQILLSLFK